MPKKSSKAQWNGRDPAAQNVQGKHYFDHDNRTIHPNSGRPRVSFKSQGRHGPDRGRNLKTGLTNYLGEDISMTVGASNGPRQVLVRGKIGRRASWGRLIPFPQHGRREGRQGSQHRPPMFADSNWFKVTIPYGHKYQKDFVVKSLNSYISPDMFVPIMYKVLPNEAVFYVDDPNTADKLYNCDRKITTNDGFKIQVRVKPGFPQVEIDQTLRERMKLAMVKRYVQETNALDLSKFHQDPDLVTDYFCALFRPLMLAAVIDIVAEHIPNLEALNLDGNKLAVIERLNILTKKLPKLKVLYIGENRIQEVSHLDVIKDLKLEELRLAGNPVCAKYKDRQTAYFSDVRKRFPRLLKLDGIILPPPIRFDVADETASLPPTQRMYVVNTDAQAIAGQFLQQYFMIFDSDNRQPLLDAYHEQASFSMTVSYGSNGNKLDSYLRENRNLFRLNDIERKRKLLKQGRLPVVSFISEMPKTKHDLDGFTMDLCLATETMMMIIVTGLFKELDGKKNPIRYFNRTFLIVPEGGGYCICNEQLHISHPTDEQEKKAFTVRQSQPSSSSTPASTSSGTSVVTGISDEAKQHMTIALSEKTKMNLEWSFKCLAEVQWDFNNALAAFQEFYTLGQIPPEAFLPNKT
ncbi:nuclear RNA export factor 1-like [Neodiprion pinetum]|uniref:Nuclear RNA export factor 1 n=1 Tax=Neodiprion lecontei TaxID=441921 RepID=A0A6J0B947_NEOLC|nr:nuclear RNA export factor 1 [Neodiprion lecontei]XP_046483912.1 nuclear RNA export factor 1-like [Neodiprion pinetum]